MKRWYTFFFLILIFLSAHSPSTASTLSVTFKNGHLTVHCRNVELRELLTEISQKTGVRVKLGSDSSGLISVDLEKVPLEKALHKILRGKNYLLMTEETAEGDNVLSVFTPGKGLDKTKNGPKEPVKREVIKQTDRNTTASRRSSFNSLDPNMVKRRASIIQKRISALQHRIDMGTQETSSPQFIAALKVRIANLKTELKRLGPEALNASY